MHLYNMADEGGGTYLSLEEYILGKLIDHVVHLRVEGIRAEHVAVLLADLLDCFQAEPYGGGFLRALDPTDQVLLARVLSSH